MASATSHHACILKAFLTFYPYVLVTGFALLAVVIRLDRRREQARWQNGEAADVGRNGRRWLNWHAQQGHMHEAPQQPFSDDGDLAKVGEKARLLPAA